MTEGKIAAFHVKVGDKINEGDNIFDVQTDKDSVPNMCKKRKIYENFLFYVLVSFCNLNIWKLRLRIARICR